MLIRVMEYQFHAMLDKIKGISLDDKYSANITLPHSIIIQLEKNKNVADYYRLTYVDSSTGQSLTQKFPVVKMWEHSITDLGKNGQHLILPFKLLEHKKNSIDVDKFLKDIFDIKDQIHNLYNTGVLSEKLYYSGIKQSKSFWHLKGLLLLLINIKKLSYCLVQE